MDAKVFGAFIQQRRKELGMSQADLAQKLHVTAKAVSRWERGVGFPDIHLLQPLADGLNITIVELMQSKMIEEDIPKEKAAELVSDTVNTIQKQGELSKKRKLILYTGRVILFAIYLFLNVVGREYDFQPRWVGAVLVVIGFLVWDLGARALYCLLTGEEFLVREKAPSYTRSARIAQLVLLLSMAALLAVLYFLGDTGNPWRDPLIVVCLACIVGSCMWMNEVEKE